MNKSERLSFSTLCITTAEERKFIVYFIIMINPNNGWMMDGTLCMSWISHLPSYAGVLFISEYIPFQNHWESSLECN